MDRAAPAGAGAAPPFSADDQYARLLDLYEALVAEGDPAPAKTIATATGSQRNTVAVRLSTARQRRAAAQASHIEGE